MDDKNDITEYRIHENNIPWLDKKFKKMSKVAEQVGAKPPEYKILREEYVERQRQVVGSSAWEGTGEYDKFYYVTVEGEAPKLAGWSFVATLTDTPGGNLISKVPGIIDDIPDKYRTAPPFCDYCGLDRKRVDSFIVRSDSGEYKQVGRNCLAKFLGYSSPERVASYATMLSKLGAEIAEEEERSFSGGRGSDYRNLEEFLTMVAAVVEEKGWISVSKAKEREDLTPTVSEVRFQLSPMSYTGKNWREFKIYPTDEHKQRAREAIEFARSDKLTTDSDYKHNLKISTASDVFHNKAAGVVASLIAFQDRDKEWEREQVRRREESEKSKAEYRKGEYVGEVGERITVPVNVVFSREIGGQFGITYLYKMRDSDGNMFTWFSSNDVLEVDKWYSITGTVKKHEEYEGAKQTILTRCKAEEIDATTVEDDTGDMAVVDTTSKINYRVARGSKRRKSGSKVLAGSSGTLSVLR